MPSPDHSGYRIAGWRDLNGMTQQDLASAVGVTKQYISMIERGRRPIVKRNLLYDIAAALGVGTADITGDPLPPASPDEYAAYVMVAALRDALDEMDDVPTRPLPKLVTAVSEVEVARVACDYPAVAAILPPLIMQARTVYRHNPAAGPLLVRAHVSAAVTLKILGHLDLATRIAEHATAVAAEIDNAVSTAAARFALAQCALAAGGQPGRRRSLTLVSRAADLLSVDLGTDEQRAWYALLNLHAAMSAASTGDDDGARTRLAEAAAAAARVKGDPWRMEITPTNVNIWRVGIALAGGEGGRAAEYARAVDRSKIRSRNRLVRLHIDTGRGLYQAGDSQRATRAFLAAAEITPQEVTRAHVREIVAQMARDSRRRGGSEELRRLVRVARVNPFDEAR